MKKNFILLISIAACVMAACGGNNDTYVAGETRIQVSAAVVRFVEVADTRIVNIMSPMPWTAHSNESWCTVSAVSQSQLSVSVEAKESPEAPDRLAVITITTSDGIKKNIAVKQGTSEVYLLIGEWLVTEDLRWDGEWYNGEQYIITMSADEEDPTKVVIEGFAPWWYEEGHTIYGIVMDKKITIPSQQLLPGWDEPDYRTYFSALKGGTIAGNVGVGFPALPIITTADGQLQINLFGGLINPDNGYKYSYQIYDIDVEDNSYAGYWCYARNTTWVKID